MAGRLRSMLRRAERDAFVPLAFALGCALEQTTPDELVDDLALAAFVARSTQTLLAADGVVNWFAPSLDARTAAAALELARRLCAQTSDRELVLGLVSAPRSEESGRAALALARGYGEAGISALLVAEAGAVDDATAYAQALRPLCNLGDYYEAPTLWLAQHAPDAGLAAAVSSSGALVAGPANEVLTFDLAAQPAGYRPGRGRLVLSSWDLPSDADPAVPAAFGRAVREGVAA